MLSSFFEIGQSSHVKEFKVRGRSKAKAAAAATKKAAKQTAKQAAAKQAPDKVQASEAATTVVHAQFDPLPPETHVPRAYDPSEAYELQNSDDEIAADEQWDYVREDADREETYEDDAASDFAEEEVSSRDDGASELSQSYDDAAPVMRRKTSALLPKPVYAGPQLVLEDDDFLD